MKKEINVYTVDELINELKKYPKDSFVIMGVCQTKLFGRSKCHRDVVSIVDYVYNPTLDPSLVLLHGAK